jgi:hypothetical protein
MLALRLGRLLPPLRVRTACGVFRIRPSAMASSKMPARTPRARSTVVAEQPAPVICADQFRTAVALTLLTGTAPHPGSTWLRHALSSIRLWLGSVVAVLRSSQAGPGRGVAGTDPARAGNGQHSTSVARATVHKNAGSNLFRAHQDVCPTRCNRHRPDAI